MLAADKDRVIVMAANLDVIPPPLRYICQFADKNSITQSRIDNRPWHDFFNRVVPDDPGFYGFNRSAVSPGDDDIRALSLALKNGSIFKIVNCKGR